MSVTRMPLCREFKTSLGYMKPSVLARVLSSRCKMESSGKRNHC